MALRRVLVYVRKARLNFQPCFDLFSIVMQELVRKLERPYFCRAKASEKAPCGAISAEPFPCNP